MSINKSSQIRNVAIIAHVDHGKTTLLDNLLKQGGAFAAHESVAERIMDSGALEKKHGITVFSKHATVEWNGIKINIIDTPGHVDFGGEVERVLSMVDGVILLVDAAEGIMPQTKYVLKKALMFGLKPIVVINKVDRESVDIQKTEEEILELFLALEANDEQCNFPLIYASGREGWAIRNLEDKRTNLSPLFELIISHIPKPKIDDNNDNFSLLITKREYDNHLGYMIIGKIASGTLRKQQSLKILDYNGVFKESAKVNKILVFKGIKKIETEEPITGDIVIISANTKEANIGDTICDVNVMEPLKTFPMDPPTISINITVNSSPLAGLEGKKVAYSVIKERLFKEAQSNTSIKITENENRDSIEVAGRGELQLSLLIETMCGEGFELSITRPKALIKIDENGKKIEPHEEVFIETDEEFIGVISDSLTMRRGDLQSINHLNSQNNRVRLHFIIPSRGLIGFSRQLHTLTKGKSLMNKTFLAYDLYKGVITENRKGVLISTDLGKATAYSLFNLAPRGKMFIGAGEQVYSGMIIGEHNRDNNLEVNVCKTKQLTNMRTSTADESVRLTRPPIVMSLEESITYIQEDEQVEVTPKSIRLRKIFKNKQTKSK